jgi:hypothetical protein
MTDLIPPKAGWKTTEFYCSLAAMLIGALYASGIISAGGTADRITGLAAAVLSALGYTVSRSLVKAAP